MVAKEGPAGRAGLLAGDRVTEIDGVSILSPRGARKFGAVRPGQSVRLTVLRDGKSLTRQLTLATRPEVRAAIAAAAPTPRAAAARRELRYAGQLDNVSVEVWSAGGPTVEKSGDTMVITVGTSVVRLKVKK
jgi:predicted metalloprotease with PDZ domain